MKASTKNNLFLSLITISLSSLALLSGCGGSGESGGSGSGSSDSGNPEDSVKVVEDFYANIGESLKATDEEEQKAKIEQACESVSESYSKAVALSFPAAPPEDACSIGVAYSFFYQEEGGSPELTALEVSGEGSTEIQEDLQITSVPVKVTYADEPEKTYTGRTVVVFEDGAWKIATVGSLSPHLRVEPTGEYDQIKEYTETETNRTESVEENTGSYETSDDLSCGKEYTDPTGDVFDATYDEPATPPESKVLDMTSASQSDEGDQVCLSLSFANPAMGETVSVSLERADSASLEAESTSGEVTVLLGEDEALVQAIEDPGDNDDRGYALESEVKRSEDKKSYQVVFERPSFWTENFNHWYIESEGSFDGKSSREDYLPDMVEGKIDGYPVLRMPAVPVG